MKEQEDTNFVRHLLVSVLTLVFCVLAVHFLAPAFIEQKARLVLSPEQRDERFAGKDAEKDTQIPPGLFDYISATHRPSSSQSDSLGEQELIDAFEKFQEDYSQKASDFLANRFHGRGLEDSDSKSDAFVVPEGLKDKVEFWRHIFGRYTQDHVIFYNPDDVGVVYSVLDFSDITELDEKSLAALKAQMISEEKARLTKVIKKVAALLANTKEPHMVPAELIGGLGREEKNLYSLFVNKRDHIDVSESALMSFQMRNGFAHRIRSAYAQSGQYMSEMRRIFRERGLPQELTVIPFVESAFNLKAYSHAGAAGVWQFIEQTGSRYLRIDEFVDERYDPILSAYAAATHLANEYKLLKSWPLTVNAYNTGPGRMLQAVRELGTSDIATIVDKFDGAGYGFDSRNYYPEFLAALDVVNHAQDYFGDVMPLPPQNFEYVMMPSAMNIKDLVATAGVSTAVLLSYNTSLRDTVASGESKLPKGYLLKIPADTKEDIMIAMHELYRDVNLATHHIVQKGETLASIARRYEIPLDRLIAVNQVTQGEKIKKGDIVKLPDEGSDDNLSRAGGLDEPVVPDDVNQPVF